MDVFKRLNYEPIPSAPSGPSNGAPTTVVNVGGPGLLGHPSFSKPKHPIPSLLRQPTLPPADDPFGLASKVYPEEELAEIKKSDVRAFYRRQNETIERFLNPPAGEIEDPEAEEMSTATKVKIAVWASTIANAFLFAGQGYAAYITGSLALFATMADAMMDLVSSIVLLATSRAVRHVDKERFPTGKSRLEVLGVIVFATLMSTVALQLIIEGVKGIVAHTGEKQETDRLAIVFILGALVMKTVLLIYCLTLREFLSARTLAQDHRNDIIINSFGLATALGGVYFAGWVDPVGCLLVGLFILRSWGSTAFEQIELLVGTSAEPEFLNLLTYLTLTFDEVFCEAESR